MVYIFVLIGGIAIGYIFSTRRYNKDLNEHYKKLRDFADTVGQKTIGDLNVIETENGVSMALSLDNSVKELVDGEYVLLQVKNMKK